MMNTLLSIIFNSDHPTPLQFMDRTALRKAVINILRLRQGYISDKKKRYTNVAPLTTSALTILSQRGAEPHLPSNGWICGFYDRLDATCQEKTKEKKDVGRTAALNTDAFAADLEQVGDMLCEPDINICTKVSEIDGTPVLLQVTECGQQTAESFAEAIQYLRT
jgi:hypothetical protein